MNTLAHPPDRWEPETAKPGVISTGHAAIPCGGVVITADWTRHELVREFKDGCCTPSRQGGSWSGASALRWESEMDDEINYIRSPMSPARAALDAAVWGKSGGRCWYCGVDVGLPPPWLERGLCAGHSGFLMRGIPLDTRMYIDHFHSQANGGSDDLSNLVPACRSCNSGKGRRDAEVFRWTGYRKKYGLPNFSLEQRQWLAAQGFVFEGFSEYRFWFEREGLS